MAAYWRISARIPDFGRPQCRHEAPANEHIRCRSGLEVDLIAMQKVEGSNPFSRFFANPLQVGRLAAAENPESTGTIPVYRLHFGH
jgi:hypothetical protein